MSIENRIAKFQNRISERLQEVNVQLALEPVRITDVTDKE